MRWTNYWPRFTCALFSRPASEAFAERLVERLLKRQWVTTIRPMDRSVGELRLAWRVMIMTSADWAYGKLR
jgi:hypothetical protein